MATMLATALLAFAPNLCQHCRQAAAAAPRLTAVRAQSGPLEEGFKELLPMATEEGNVDPELVARVEAQG